MLIGAVSSIWNLFFIWQRWYRDVPARCIGTGMWLCTGCRNRDNEKTNSRYYLHPDTASRLGRLHRRHSKR